MSQDNKPSHKTTNNIYLFSGEDEFRKRLSLNKLKDRLLGEKIDPFNYEVFDAKEHSAEEVICSLGTLSFTGRKLVVLHEPELLTEDDRLKLTAYLEQPQKDRTSSFVLLSTRLPRANDRLSKALSKHARVINFPALKDAEVSAWIIDEFKNRSKTASRRTAELIRGITKGDLGRSYSMIEQLSAFVGERERITEGDVEKFYDSPSENSTFKLLDTINKKDRVHSLSILRALLRSNNTPQQIIGMLNWHITRLIKVKKLLINRATRVDMASSLGMGSYSLNRLILQTESISLKTLRRHLNRLLDTDLMLKRSGIRGDLLLEILVVNLTGTGPLAKASLKGPVP